MSKNKNSWWNRFRVMFNAKAHKALDNAETVGMKIDMVKQKTRELETSYKKAVEGLSKIKALEIKYKNSTQKAENSAKSYQDKAKKLKTRFDSAGENDKEQLKSDIILMLNKQETMSVEANSQRELAVNQKGKVDAMTIKIKSLSDLITSTKSNTINMEAQAQAAKVNKEVSSELSSMNFDGVTSQLSALQSDIDADNAEGEAWSEIGSDLEGDEKRIEKMLAESSPTEDSDLFTTFMKD